MSANALLVAPRAVGRPSNAALTLRTHVLAGEVERLTEDRDDLVAELTAYAAERRDVHTAIVAAARRGMRDLAAGRSPANALVEIEAMSLREQLRAGSMGLAHEDPEERVGSVLLAVPA